MEKKIVTILVLTLFIAAAVLPAVGTMNKTINGINVQTQSKGAYDMVIIAPSIFSGTLQPLIDFKNKHGINTMLMTTENIYKNYTGRDKPEQIKYFIKYALDTWNITYVLLVGGMKSHIFGTPQDDVNQGSNSWWVPVRYSNLNDNAYNEKRFICDLYYADIYDSNGNFSSWDSNNDGVFARWDNHPGKDILDLYPDVCLGRLACRNKLEVKIMVDKIIKYESTPADPSWFKKMVVVGGEEFNDVGTNYLEGEVICDKALSYMQGFTPVKIYASNKLSGGLVPNTNDIVSTVSKGCGFLFFEGFGNPSRWSTHWPGDFNNWTDGLKCSDFSKLKNNEKLPICVAGANWLAQFNVTFLNTLLNPIGMNIGGIKYGGCLALPECFGWWLAQKKDGGSIATIAKTANAYLIIGENGDMDHDGVNNPDCVEGMDGYLFTHFFEIYYETHGTLGQVYKLTIKKYLDTFPGMKSQTDCKTVEATVLLGDPSLKIGGYTN